MNGRPEARVRLPVVRRQHVDVMKHDAVQVDRLERFSEADVHQRRLVEDVRERLEDCREAYELLHFTRTNMYKNKNRAYICLLVALHGCHFC